MKNRRSEEVASQREKLDLRLLDRRLLPRASERLPLEPEMERVTFLVLALLPVLLRRRLRNRLEGVDRGRKEVGSACLSRSLVIRYYFVPSLCFQSRCV